MTIFNKLSETKKTEYAIQMVIMDAIDKGQTNKEELIGYMASDVFENAVKNYKSLMA